MCNVSSGYENHHKYKDILEVKSILNPAKCHQRLVALKYLISDTCGSPKDQYSAVLPPINGSSKQETWLHVTTDLQQCSSKTK